MAGEEPPKKKCKFSSSEVDEKESFLWFHENKLLELESALSSLRDPLSGYGVVVSKIVFCDAQTDKCFGNATCRCKELRIGDEKYPKGYSVINIFQLGIDMIEAYIESPKNIPERKGARLALSRLLTFWSSIGSTEEALAHLPAKPSETELTVTAAHHLLSKLTVASTYILDKVSTGKSMKKDHKCTCGCGDKILGIFGETSLGVESYWHGRVDILMDVAVRTFPTEEPDSPGAGNRSSVEMKSTKVKMATSRDQIRAETIVFSFLARKIHPELDNFLIPTIVLSESHVAVCLYDCENDILLETPLLGLFQQGNDELLSKATIILLWLALNFKYCCSGVPDEIIETGYTADFFRHAGPVLETYKNNVVAPCDYVAECDWAVLPIFETLPKKKDTTNVNRIPNRKN